MNWRNLSLITCCFVLLGSWAVQAAENDQIPGKGWGRTLQQADKQAQKEEEEALWTALGVSYLNKYLAKGVLATDGPVMQVNAEAQLYDFYFNFFANMDLDNVNGNRGEFNELDFTLGYTFHAWDFALTVGGNYAAYPHTDNSETWSAFAQLGYDWIITPTVTLLHDMDEIQGQYLLFALEYAHEISSPLPAVFTWDLYLTTGLGWASADSNNASFEVDENAFVDYYIGVEIPITIYEHFVIMPTFYHYWIMDSDIRSKTGYDDQFLFGITVGAAF